MDPSDFDGDSDGLSFNELPPSVRQRAMGAMGFTRPDRTPLVPQAIDGSAPQEPRRGLTPVGTVEEYQGSQGGIQTPQEGAGNGTPGSGDGSGGNLTPKPATDNAPWLMVAAVAVLGGIGWWAYSKMEKDKKIRVGPPRLGKGGGYGAQSDDDDGDYDDDGPAYGEDDGDDDASLDAYAKVKKPRKIVSPHEKGGIKLVKG